MIANDFINQMRARLAMGSEYNTSSLLHIVIDVLFSQQFISVGTINNPDAKVAVPTGSQIEFDGTNGVVRFCGVTMTEEWLESALIRLRNKIGESKYPYDYSYAEFPIEGGRVRFTRDTRIVEFPNRFDLDTVRGRMHLDMLRRIVALCDKVPPRAKG